MNKLCLLIAVLLAIAIRGDAQERPLPERSLAPPYRSWTISQTFKETERACFVAIGSGATYLGVYVYDEDGNCVAWDDHTSSSTCDDIAVAWFPHRSARYTVEVHNLGKRRNVFEYSIRK